MNLHIGVKILADGRCDKKNVIEILKKYFNIKERADKDKKALILGNIVHKVAQIALKSRINELEYLYFEKYKKSKGLSDILYEVLKNTLKRFVDISEYKFQYNDVEFSDDFFQTSIRSSYSYLRNIAKLASKYINIEEDFIQSDIIEDELTINWQLNTNFQLKGKIDLICKLYDEIHLIEIKTGEIYEQDKYQLQLYGEILKKQYSNTKFKLFLWYPKRRDYELEVMPNDDKKGIDLIEAQKVLTQEVIEKKKNFSEIRKVSKYLCDQIYCNYCDNKKLIDGINNELRGGTITSFLKKFE